MEKQGKVSVREGVGAAVGGAAQVSVSGGVGGMPAMPRRVGAVLDGDHAAMLDVVLAVQFRAFSDWLKRTIELDYREATRDRT